MTFKILSEFIQNKMRMSHIYQPVMIKFLLEKRGQASVQDIAKELLSYDESQIEYYQKIVQNMVGKVLLSHEVVSKDAKLYSLNDFDQLSASEVSELKILCESKLNEFIEHRGQTAWQHRKKSSGYISGTIRYEVLKRAKFHCELCGISADKKALEVDHIIPRNKDGTDDLSNLQALCYSCNAMKRDRDDTDFRVIRESFDRKEDDCLFCHIEKERAIIAENELAFAIHDGYPVTNMHTLVIPKRHVQSYFGLGRSEINACNQLLEQCKDEIISKDSDVSGFNVGINDGQSAGQTIFHCHIHLIPRRAGDVEKPKGGVRGVIPSKQRY
ncbi:HIT domain-containing protein [Pseudomonadota bacterium]